MRWADEGRVIFMIDGIKDNNRLILKRPQHNWVHNQIYQSERFSNPSPIIKRGDLLKFGKAEFKVVDLNEV